MQKSFNQGQPQVYSPIQTKQDFPNMKTRGRVVENRMDVELEKNGSIFQGRDEKNIIFSKREQQAQEMKNSLLA
jgi:hypothetical protein